MNIRIAFLLLMFGATHTQAQQFIATDIINNQNPTVTEPIIQLVEAFTSAVKQLGTYEKAFMYLTTEQIVKKLPCYAYFKSALFNDDDQKTINFLCYKMIDVYQIFAEQ